MSVALHPLDAQQTAVVLQESGIQVPAPQPVMPSVDPQQVAQAQQAEHQQREKALTGLVKEVVGAQREHASTQAQALHAGLKQIADKIGQPQPMTVHIPGHEQTGKEVAKAIQDSHAKLAGALENVAKGMHAMAKPKKFKVVKDKRGKAAGIEPEE